MSGHVEFHKYTHAQERLSTQQLLIPFCAGDLCTCAAAAAASFEADGGKLVPTGGTFLLQVSTVMPGVPLAAGAVAVVRVVRGGVRISTGLRAMLRVSRAMPVSDSVSVDAAARPAQGVCTNSVRVFAFF